MPRKVLIQEVDIVPVSFLRQNRSFLQLLHLLLKYVATESLTQAEPIPKHTSILTGRAWLDELLHGHPDRIKQKDHLVEKMECLLRAELGLHEKHQRPSQQYH